MARVYWMRSLVPRAKKSASAARASAASAAPGISIITPSGGSVSGMATPRRFKRRATCTSAPRTRRTSPTFQITGRGNRGLPEMSGGAGLVELAGPLEVGLEHDLDPVAGHRGQAAQLVELAALVAQLVLAGAIAGDRSRARVEDDDPG